MRLLSLDYDPVFGDDTLRSTFESDTSVFDFDVVIWDPESTFNRYVRRGYGQSYQGLYSLSDNESVSLKSDIARRRSEMAEFLRAGRTVVVIVRPPQECYVATGEVKYSGTGRNRAATRTVAKVDLWSAVPVSDLTLVRASGSRITPEGDGPLASLLRKYKNFASYEAIMTSAPGVKFAAVDRTDRIVGSSLKTKDGGLFILMPALDLLADAEEEDDDVVYVDEASDIQAELLEAIEKMSNTATSVRPAWTEKYATKGQIALRQSVAKQQARVELARTKLTVLKQEQEESEAKDQLFLGTGRALELQVKEVLQLLGGTVTEPEPGRDDWKVEFPERRAVVEVKGVKKSAAEKYAAQLEKWVATEMEQLGSAPKGILVVNTWRETELDLRTEKDFPDQMLPYSEGRDHCLVTGLQLFAIRIDIEKDSTKAEYWRDKILNTSGILLDTPEWRTILTKTEEKESSEK